MLPLSGFNSYDLYDDYTSTWRVSREQAAQLLRMHGPCVVAMFVSKDYFFDCCGYDDDDDVDPVLFRGCPREPEKRRKLQVDDPLAGNHAVLCYAYRFVGEELHLGVLDNQTTYGPRRWVLYEALDRIVTTRVEPLDPSSWVY